MRAIDLALIAVLATPCVVQAQAPESAELKSRLESGQPASPGQVTRTATGWKVATTASGFWWDPAMVGKKGFSVILNGDLSAKSPGNVFGVFVGGRDLVGRRPSYVSFQIKADGTYRLEVWDQGENHNRIPWTQHRAITVAIGDEPTRYRIRLDVHPLRLDFVVNDIKMHSINRSTVRAEGIVGLRLGAGLNMDIADFLIEPID